MLTLLLVMSRSEPGSILSDFLDQSIPLTPTPRAIALEDSKPIAQAHYNAAKQGGTFMSDNPADEPDGHFVAFVQSSKNGHIYEMYGNHKGPIDLGPLVKEGEDLLSDAMRKVIKGFLERDGGTNPSFSLLALAHNQN